MSVQAMKGLTHVAASTAVPSKRDLHFLIQHMQYTMVEWVSSHTCACILT